MSAPNKKPVLLCVANWDSNVGYAWWLMESFWIKIHAEFSPRYNVIIAYPSISSLPAAIQAAHINTIEFNFNLEKSSDLTGHIRFIKQHNITAIYFTDRPTAHWSYLFFRLAGVKKIVTHDHTPGIRTKPSGIKKIIKYLRARLPFVTVDGAVGATEYVRDRLINISCLPARKCFAAPNGLPPLSIEQPVAQDLRSYLGVAQDTIIIVSTGRANIYKGIDFALEVIAQLVHTHSAKNIHYIYCGDGPDLDYLKSMVNALAISKYATFMGRVSNIDQILSECDIAFHPSRGEVGYSLSILEYMRAGLPVVVSDNPSVCEATNHNGSGLIYHEDMPQDACEKIMLLVKNSDLRQSLGTQGKRAVAERYSLEQTHAALIKALNTIFNN